MVTENVQGPIPLEGEGFVARQYGHYQPGQYKRLSNMEYKNDVLTARRNVKALGGNGVSIWNHNCFMGSLGEYSLLNTAILPEGFSYHYAVSANGPAQQMWNTFTDVDGFPTFVAGAFVHFKGFFRYNYKNYWLTLEFWPTEGYKFVLYHCDIPTDDTIENYTYNSGIESELSRTVILEFPETSPDFDNLVFRNFFLYKERLWIATSVGLYYSKATDPTVFLDTEGSGGFFKYPNDTVTWGMAIGDTVYVLCTSSVYAITYSLSPNDDATQRPISEIIGGEMGCIHLDTPYFINNLGIYAIHGTNVEKLMDSRFDVGEDYYRNHLYSFENYLVVNRYEHTVFAGEQGESQFFKNFWPAPRSSLSQGIQISKPDEAWSREAGWTGDIPPSRPFGILTTTQLSYNAAGTPKDSEGRAMYSMYSSNLTIQKYTHTDDAYTPYLKVSRSIPVSDFDGATKLNLAFEAFKINAKRLSSLRVRVLADSAQIHSSTVSMTSVPVGVPQNVSVNFTIPNGATNVTFEFYAYHGTISMGALYTDFGMTMNRFMLQDRDNPNGMAEFFAGDDIDEDYRTYSWEGTPYNSTSILEVAPLTMAIAEGPTFEPFKAGNALGYNTFFINTDNGSTHVLDFKDRSAGYIVDMYINHTKDSSGNYHLYFICAEKDSFTPEIYLIEPYSMSSSESLYVRDYVKNEEGVYVYQSPGFDVEIDSFVPDGNEHRVKKFRNLQIQGIFPKDGLKLHVAYNNQPYSDGIDLKDTIDKPSKRPHYPHRIGLNQRGRSLSLRFKADPQITSSDGLGVFELSDVRTLWTYSARAASNRNQS